MFVAGDADGDLQGKNERFHQTLFRYLDKQPLAETLEQLQTQVDAFDHIYNTERPHQGLPGRVTPATAWEATPKTEAPRPQPVRPLFERPTPPPRREPPVPLDLPDDTHLRRLSTSGCFSFEKVTYMVDGRRAFEHVLVIVDGDQITITDTDGEILAEHARPGPGTKYVGNGRPRGPRQDRDETSPMP